MNAPRLREITMTKGLAVIGVLIIHATAPYAGAFEPGFSSQFIVFVLNKAAHFSVPAFILLSGLLLGYRYVPNWDTSRILTFYRRRFVYLLIPYVIWTAVYMYLNPWVHGEKLQSDQASLFLKALLTGSAGYHLYFILLIGQYYLLFPVFAGLLKRLVRAFPRCGIPLFLVFAVFIEAAGGAANLYFNWELDKSILFTTYIVSFCAGCCIGANYDQYKIRLARRQGLLHTAAAVLLVIHVGRLAAASRGWQFSPFVSEGTVQLYCIAATLFLLNAMERLQRAGRGGKRIPRACYNLGIVSFGVYLIHPGILELWWMCEERFFTFRWYELNVAGAFLVGLGLAFLICWQVRKLRYYWVWIGK